MGGGASPLAARLLDAGFRVCVLDISDAALQRARARMGDPARRVQWVAADVTRAPPLGRYDVWHDRACFHFLTDPAARRRYTALLRQTLPPGGHAVLATFAPDGPPQCSGLDVLRYDGESLARELGGGFELLKSVPEVHHTPWGTPQAFQYSVFRCAWRHLDPPGLGGE